MLARWASTGLAVTCALLAAGPANAAAPVDPCRLVTKTDAAKALGSPIATVRPMTAGSSRICAFHGTKPLQSVVVTAFGYDSPAQAHTRFIDIVQQTAHAAAAGATRMKGIGDEAVAIDASVYVRKGTAALVFNIFGVSRPPPTARTVALAKSALARMR
jgi:hypothetical protein